MRRGFALFRRRRSWGTTLLLFTIGLLLLQLLAGALLLTKGVDRMLASAAGVHLEVLPNASDRAIQEFYGTVLDLPYVEEALYLPREKVYERERLRDPALVQFLEEYKLSNPFPDMFSVTLKSVNDYGEFAIFLGQEEWRSVIDASVLSFVATQERDITQLFQVTAAVRAIIFLFLGVGILLLVAMIADAAGRRIEEQSDEISMKNLLGGDTPLVALPIATELTVLLVFALVLGTLLSLLLLWAVPSFSLLFPGSDLFARVQSETAPVLLASFPVVLLCELVLLPLIAYFASMALLLQRRTA